jgi:hypothetical protein
MGTSSVSTKRMLAFQKQPCELDPLDAFKDNDKGRSGDEAQIRRNHWCMVFLVGLEPDLFK